VKLLFDANLSRRIVPLLEDLFPGSLHIKHVGLAGDAPDSAIWNFAKENGFCIVTADSDFVKLSNDRDVPPQVIRLEQMNYSTAAAATLIRQYAIAIAEFETRGKPLLTLRKLN
jgi:predicted nuclease of predicted toxin-antitoxin system